MSTIPRDLSTEISSCSPRAIQHSHDRASTEVVTQRFPSEREEEFTVLAFLSWGVRVLIHSLSLFSLSKYLLSTYYMSGTLWERGVQTDMALLS